MKGTKDYYPKDKRIQNYIFSVWKKIAEKYGYEEVEPPILESAEIYKKSGQRPINPMLAEKNWKPPTTHFTPTPFPESKCDMTPTTK